MAKLWGGRFTKKTNPLVEQFTKSIHYDQKLAEFDCIGSLTHIEILFKAKVLNIEEYKKLEKGLKEILEEIRNGPLKDIGSYEDIHSYIQKILENKVGSVALKLHTCRSRNDQVVFDMKFYCRHRVLDMREALVDVRESLVKLAKKNKGIYMPGYTHLQHAIPILLSEYLMVYSKMLEEDGRRLSYISENIKLTMGSGALAGTFIKSHNYNMAANELFSELKSEIKPTTNPIYTVSDRDFILEILNALAIAGMHLSRLAEDFVLWATKEFDFIDIDESFCTGSSLMPQKKNPDVLELIRGYSGRLYGNLISVLVMMKGLPLSYNRDMQLDKEPLFNSFEIIESELKILAELLPNIKFKKENIAKQLEDECLYATDMTDYLVQKRVPFKEAHTIIGKLIHYKLTSWKEILSMTKDELKKFHPLLTPVVMKRIIDPKHSVESKKSIKRTVK